MAPRKAKAAAVQLPDFGPLVLGADPRPLLSAIQEALSSPQLHYKVVQTSLDKLFFREIDAATSVDFLLACLEVLVLESREAGAVADAAAGLGPAGPTSTEAGGDMPSSAASQPVAAGDADAIAAASEAASVAAEAASQAAEEADVARDLAEATMASAAVAADAGANPKARIASDPERRRQQQEAWNTTISHLLLELMPQSNSDMDDASSQPTSKRSAGGKQQPRPSSTAAPNSDNSTAATPSETAAAAAAATPGPLAPELLQDPARRARVLALFSACLTETRHARLALKLAQAFELKSADLPDRAAAAAAVAALLADRVTLTPGLGLVTHFQDLCTDLDRPALLALLVEEGREAAAEKWAAGLSRGDQIAFVEACIAADRLRAAAHATRAFGLRPEFPDIEARYRRASVARLAAKRVWGVAASFVGTDTAMQIELLQQMIAMGEAAMADEYRKRFRLPPEALPALDPKEVARQEVERAARYLPLELPPLPARVAALLPPPTLPPTPPAPAPAPAPAQPSEGATATAAAAGAEATAASAAEAGAAAGPGAVPGPSGRPVWVDGPMGLRAAALLLAGADVVGLDVEWRAQGPDRGEGDGEGGEEGEEEAGEALEGAEREGRGGNGGGGTGERASLLQIATRDAAMLFDLPALCAGGASGGGRPNRDQEAGSVPTGPADRDLDSDLDIDDVLGPLFGPGGALVIGFGLSGDLSKLASSYPHVAAFRRLEATLDLQELWRAHLVAQAQASRPKNAPPVQLPARSMQAGLSTLAAGLLGRPLDKTMQVSDWEARPLTVRQMTYAAQDAHVLVRLYDAFHQRMPAGLAAAIVRERTVPYIAAPPPGGGAARRRQGGASAGDTPRRRRRGSVDGDDGDGGSGNGEGGADTSGAPAAGAANPSRTAAPPPLPGRPGEAAGAAAADGGSGGVGAGGRGGLIGPAAVKALTKVYGSAPPPPPPPIAAVTAAAAAAAATAAAATRQLPPSVAAALEAKGLGGAVRWLAPPSTGSPWAQAGPTGAREGCAGANAERAADRTAADDSGPNPDSAPPPPPPLIPPTATAAEAAAAVGIPTAAVAKSVAVLVAGKPFLAAVRGDQRLCWHKVAAAVGVGRRALRVATPGECLSAYGFAPGTLPPFGHPSPVPVLVDVGLAAAAVPPLPEPAPTSSTSPSAAPSSSGASAPASTSAPAATEPPASAAAGPGPFPPLATATADDDVGGDGRRLLFCGSGHPHAMICLTYDQLLAVSGGRAVEIADEDLTATTPSPSVSQSPSPYGSGLDLAGAAGPVVGPGAAAQAQASSGGATAFLLDSMLGRLCRWLRCLGLDAEYVGRSSPSKAELARMTARAAREGRVFLTRDQRLAERRDVSAPYVLHSDDAAEQLDELVRHFNVRFDEALVMSRCNACNAAAFELVTPREAARELVPARVFELVDEFWRCGCCGKVFWMGPKSASAIALVGGMLARSRGGGGSGDGEGAGDDGGNGGAEGEDGGRGDGGGGGAGAGADVGDEAVGFDVGQGQAGSEGLGGVRRPGDVCGVEGERQDAGQEEGAEEAGEEAMRAPRWAAAAAAALLRADEEAGAEVAEGVGALVGASR